MGLRLPPVRQELGFQLVGYPTNRKTNRGIQQTHRYRMVRTPLLGLQLVLLLVRS